MAKKPGAELELAEPATTRLPLAQLPDADPLPPYVALIHDVLTRRPLAVHHRTGWAGWAAVQPLLDDPPPVQPYAPGSWGPAAADELAAPHGWVLGGAPE